VVKKREWGMASREWGSKFEQQPYSLFPLATQRYQSPFYEEAFMDDTRQETGGIALIPNDNELASLVAAGGGRSSYVTCSIPSTVRPGQYRLQIVTRPPNGERRTVTRSAIGDGVPNAINITVSAGEANGGGYGMGLLTLSTNIVKNVGSLRMWKYRLL
jgi:hypothetical protein